MENMRFIHGLKMIAAILALAMIAFACESDVKIQTSKQKTKKADAEEKAAPADTKAVAAVTDDYVYTSIGKRDPFRSIFEEVGGQDLLEKDTTILTPLQNYEVSSFSVKAVIWGVSSPTALVQAPDGKTYLVKNGTLIGRNWGKVVKIKRDAIVILEKSLMPDGTSVENMVELKLPVKTIRASDQEMLEPDFGEAQ